MPETNEAYKKLYDKHYSAIKNRFELLMSDTGDLTLEAATRRIYYQLSRDQGDFITENMKYFDSLPRFKTIKNDYTANHLENFIINRLGLLLPLRVSLDACLISSYHLKS
jgi:hypothetical protein